MKKQLLSASAVLLMVVLGAGCAKNEVITNSDDGVAKSGQIAFRASTGKTRANDYNLTNVKGGFNVIALNKAGDYLPGFADPLLDNVTYFYNEVAIPNLWDWKDAATKNAKTWPTDPAVYPLSFFTAYPLSTTITKDAKTVAANVASNIATNAGFIYNTYFEKVANAVTPTIVSVDELAALSTVNGKPVSGFADLTFKHIMSNVAFDIVVPAGFKADIQSIKIANINKSGRTYDYSTQTWSAEAAYIDTNHAHFAHSLSNPAQVIESTSKSVKGFTDATTGFNTLKLMPQTGVSKWALGANKTEANSFKKDAAAWVAANTTVNDAAITTWHNSEVASGGMKNSEGWKGARIELVYRLIDQNGKVVVGQKNGVNGAIVDRFIRIGYVLDLSVISVKSGALVGFQPGYKYTFQIPLGTADATNGTLLDPDYKDADGGSTNEPVDNPKISPGDPVTSEGLINFNVTVDEWSDWTGNIN